MVKEDKSLIGFIESGERWLLPLLEFRNWLVAIRNERKLRQKCRRGGRWYLIKNKAEIDQDSAVKVPYEDLERYIFEHKINLADMEQEIIVEKDEGLLFPEEYLLGLGPFTLKTRRSILARLLEVQGQMGIMLIKPEEVAAIKEIWKEEEGK